MQEMYAQVAKLFADKINVIFESETTLQAEFQRHFDQLPFDRTKHWAGIIYLVMRECWLEAGPEVRSEPTGYDKLSILKQVHPLLDYNLFSQVLLNLQNYTGMHYMTGDATKEIARMRETWPKDAKLNPFAPRAHMVKQAALVNEEQKQYNTILSTLRALRIIAQFTPQVSSRVSPKGATPALADSGNLSMIGEGGDRYIRTLPDLGAFYLTWDRVPPMAAAHPSVPPDPRGMRFSDPRIPYDFYSRSGGEILQDVLFVRWLLYEIFAAIDVLHETCIMVPRLNSILIVGDKHGISLKQAIETLKIKYPVHLVEGARA
jgi:hypothetical protein